MMLRPESIEELDAVVEALDTYGLSAIAAPNRLAEMSDDEAHAFGERARELDVVIGEAHFLTNLLVPDAELRARRVQELRALLRKADLMGSRCVLGFVGSVDPIDDIGAPDPYMLTDACQEEFRDIALRVLDGLELRRTRFLVEANSTTFFYRPEDIADFLARLDHHPLFGVHLDQMNMIDQRSIHDTTNLIRRTFDLLGPHIGGAHLKDLRWDWHHLFLKFDEVLIGDGVMDYPLLLAELDKLDPDLPCLCEHLETEGEYAINFARLHRLAARNGSAFAPRRAVGARA